MPRGLLVHLESQGKADGENAEGGGSIRGGAKAPEAAGATDHPGGVAERDGGGGDAAEGRTGGRGEGDLHEVNGAQRLPVEKVVEGTAQEAEIAGERVAAAGGDEGHALAAEVHGLQDLMQGAVATGGHQTLVVAGLADQLRGVPGVAGEHDTRGATA